MLIGHTAARTQLADMLAAGRFPHSVLIHGPKGIGKRALAEQLGLRLMCGPAGAEAELFGPPKAACPLAHDASSAVAAQITVGSCPDWHVVALRDKKKSIGVEQARELLAILQRSADTARVVLVDALDDLTDEAANTLLKTLEEPRPNIYFVLVCHQLTAALPTIRSRCRLVRLNPLNDADTRAVLRQNGADETLAAVAGGAPGRVMGSEAEAVMKAREQVKGIMAGTATLTANAGYIPFIPDAAQSVLVGQPTLSAAEAYQAIAALKVKAAEMNLPAALVAEGVVNAMDKIR